MCIHYTLYHSTIFKTITDELGNTKLSVNNGLKGLFNGNFFKKHSILNDDDISALQAYNAELNRGVTSQTAFYRTMQNASVEAQNMAASTNGMVVNLEQIPKVSKAGQVALKGLAIAGNMIAMWAISKVLQVATEKITELANASEIAEEKATNFANSVNNATKDMSSNFSTLSSLNGEYQKLSEGVNALGENVSLSTDEYGRYKEVVQQISDIMPNMTTYFNAQGEKIAFAKGELSDLNAEYEEYIQTQAKEFLVNGDEDGNKLQDALDNFGNNSQMGLWESLKNTIKNVFGSYDINDLPVDTIISTLEDLQNKSRKEIIEYFNDVDLGENGEYLQTEGNRAKAIAQDVLNATVDDIRTMTDEEFNTLQDTIANNIESLQNSNDVDMSAITSGLLQAAYSKDNFWAVGEDIRNDITTMLSSIDADTWKSLGITEQTEVENFVGKLITAISSNKDGITDAWNGLFSPDLETLPVSEYVAKVNSYMDVIANALGLDEEGKKNLMISLGFNIDTSSAILNGVKKKLDSVGDKWVDTLNISDLEIVASDEFDKVLEKQKKGLNGAALSADDYATALQSVKDARNNTNETDIFSGFSEDIDTFQSNIKSLSDALSSINSGDFSGSELVDFLQQFPELTNKTDNLSTAIEELAEEKFKTLISEMEKVGVSTSVLSLIKRIHEESLLAATGVDSLENALKKLQNSDKALKDLKSEFQSTGKISDATINDLISKFPELSNVLLGYINNLYTEKEVIESISKAYDTDYDNYVKYYQSKMQYDSNYYNTVISNVDNNIKNLAKSYGIDLSNCKNLAQAKLEVETKLVKKQLDLWGNYYSTLSQVEKENLWTLDEKTGKPLKKVDRAVSMRSRMLQNAADKINSALDDVGANFTTEIDFTPATSSTTGSSSSTSTETFNWIETKLSRIQRVITNLGKTISATYKSWTTRNNALAQELSAVTKEINTQEEAYNYYLSKANSVNLSSYYKDLVRNGSISIQDIADETLKNAIKEFQELYNKALECSDSIQDLKDKLAELAKQKFDNLSSEFDNALGDIEHRVSMIDGSVELIEKKGYIAGKEYYQNLINRETENIKLLENEYKALNNSIKEAMQNGEITEGSDDWYDMMDKIYDVEEALQDANISLQEYINTMRELDWSIFDKGQEYISYLQDEANFIIDLLDNKDLFDDKGQMNDYGKSVLGLYAMNYNTYMSQADAYAEELKKLNEEIANDPSNTLLLERRQELLDKQQEMIQAAEEEKQAMIDLKRSAYDALLDSLQSIIDKRKEALRVEKDYYDFQRSIAEQTKSIASYEKQLMAYDGDNSEEVQSKIQQIKVSLEEAKQNLEETEYDKYISDQEQLLDELFSETEQWLNERLDNVDGLLSEIIEDTNANAEVINDTIGEVTKEVGYEITDAMREVWSLDSELGKVVSEYNDNFDNYSTKIQEVLKSILDSVGNIVKNTTVDKVDESTSTVPSSGGSSGTGNNSGGSTGGSSNNGGSSSVSNSKKWGWWFVKSSFSGNKSNLNIGTSIVDRLKYNDIESSFSNRKSYYNAMGGSGTYTGSSSQNQWMIKQMKENGFKSGGTIGSLIKGTGEDGFLLARTGEEILSLDKIKELGITFQKINPVIDSLKELNIPSMSTRNNTLPNVTVDIGDIQVVANDPQEFATQLKTVINNDTSVRKILKDSTIGEALGKNSFTRFSR